MTLCMYVCLAYAQSSQFTVVSESKGERDEEEGEGEEEAQMSLLEQHKAKLEASGKKKKKGKERDEQEAEKAAVREEKIRKVWRQVNPCLFQILLLNVCMYVYRQWLSRSEKRRRWMQ